MSRENVEIVRRSFEAFARGDFEAAFAAHDAGTEWRTAADEPDQQTYQGIAGLRRFVDSLLDHWEDRFADVMEFEAFIDRGDWVIAPWTARLQGRASGVSVQVRETYAAQVRAGKIVRVEEYRTKEEALEAVGSHPQPDSAAVRIGIVVFDGFDELDALGPYEVFRNAGLDARLLTREPAERVTGSHGLAIEAQGRLDGSFDLVVVPGGGWNDRAERGAWGEARRGDLPRELARLHGEGTPLASVCTGGMLLSAAGLLRGRPATTHHEALDELAEAGAETREERVVDDGDIVTAGGVTSGIDLALWIVERELGLEAAERVAREMEHDRRGSVAQTGAE